MNREYSKGEALYLTEFARVQSTFAGHYDLTAYLVLVLPILFAILLGAKNIRAKIGLGLTQVAGIWLLLAGSSKSSLAAYGITIAIVLFFKFKDTHRSSTTTIKWIFLSILGGTVVVISLLFIAPEFYRSVATLTKTIPPVHTIVLKIDAKLPDTSPLKLQRNQTLSEDNLKPDDVYINVPDLVKVATTSATGETTYTIIEKERVWSENALKYGLSMGIRLDTLWPLALKGFMKNPLTGSGYATLTKGDTTVYTEADSTDNNYLRTLGETGLVGFLFFFGSIAYLLQIAYRSTNSKDSLIKALNIGFIAGTVGLLLNAITIDVFAASKVAFTFWSLSGLVLASHYITSPQGAVTKEVEFFKKMRKFSRKYGILLLFSTLFFFLLYENPFTEKSSILNFAVNPSGAEHIAAARCFLKTGTLALCRGNLVYSAGADVYALLLVPFLKIYNNPGMYFVLNLLLAFSNLFLFMHLLRKISRHSFIRTAAFIVLISNSTFITAVATPSAALFLVLLTLLTLPVTYRHRALTLFAAISTGSVALLISDKNATLTVLILLGFAFALEWIYRRTQAIKKEKISVFIGALIKISTIGLASILFTFTYLSANTLKNITHNFQGTHPNWRYTAVSQMNDFFLVDPIGKNGLLSPDQTPYLITAINPYYIDMFTNGMYQLLPLSTEQNYMDHPNLVWGEHNYTNLIQLYHQILQSRPLLVSDFDLSEKTRSDFTALHKNFDLDILRLGCNYNCILYQVHEQQPFISPKPKTIATELVLEELPEEYTFTIMSNRFNFTENLAAHSLKSLIPVYIEANKSADFSIITGDVLQNYDQGQTDALANLYLTTPKAPPTFFAPGNFDVIPQKSYDTGYHYFYTSEDYYLFISTNANGTISESRQKYILNQLLDLENMDSISTVFLIVDQANWVGYDPSLQPMSELSISTSPTSADSFMIQQVLPRLKHLSSKNIYIISGDMKPNLEKAQFEHHLAGTNLTFLASGISNTTGDRFIEFVKNAGKWSYIFRKVE